LRSFERCLCWAVLAALLLGSPNTCLAVEGKDTPAPGSSQLREILQRFNTTQESTRSLTASFTEKKNLTLLARPVISTGTFLYSKPTRIKWEYTNPEPRMFLITEDHFLAYYPAQKRAEEVPLGKLAGRRVFRVFGIGQTAEDLEKFFDISLGDAGPEKGTFLLVLTPKRRRVKDRLQLVRFWVDDETYLPRQLEYVEADGDTTTLTFSNIRVNPEISEARFVVEIPKDVPISNTFSGFTGTTVSR
jgi:outer membrane lipoprotein-sorting protein